MSLAKDLSELLRERGMMLVTAESCTGGMIASSITDLAGSSDIFDRGFITYSNEAKQDMLGVSPETLAEHGAVSEHTAREMAQGALTHARATASIAVTGIAGPGGGSADKPVGLVYIATVLKDGKAHVTRNIFEGDRAAIRQATVEAALSQLKQMLS